jgi:sugar/nucleoside kinase (ribokinase family)
MAVLVVGSIALDSVNTPEGSRDEMLGGSATYFSLAASHLSPVRLVAVVGDDFPEEHRQLLADRSIDLDGLQILSGKTFRWSGEYRGAMNEAITLDTQLNVFQSFEPVIPRTYRNTEWVFLGNIDPVLQQKVMEQVPEAKLIALDTMNFWIEGSKDQLLATLKSVNLLLINEAELYMLAGTTNMVKAAKRVRELGPDTIVVKRGEYGAALFYRDEWFFVPGYPEENVTDPTGAGDSFAGGFMGSIAQSGKLDFETLKKAMIYGSVMASFNIQTFGPWFLAGLSREQIESKFAAFQKLVTLQGN